MRERPSDSQQKNHKMEELQECIYQIVINAPYGSKFILNIPRRYGKTTILKRIAHYFGPQCCMLETVNQRTFDRFTVDVPDISAFNGAAVNGDTIVFIDNSDHCRAINIPPCKLTVVTITALSVNENLHDFRVLSMVIE